MSKKHISTGQVLRNMPNPQLQEPKGFHLHIAIYLFEPQCLNPLENISIKNGSTILFKLQTINTKEYQISATCRAATAPLLLLLVVPPLRYHHPLCHRPSCHRCATPRGAAAATLPPVVPQLHVVSPQSCCQVSRCGALLHAVLSSLPSVVPPQSWCRLSRRQVSCRCDRAATCRAACHATAHIVLS